MPPADGEDGPAASKEQHPSIWHALKSCVGKDLSRIALPVWLNEPLSFLQRAAEDIEYSELLDAAAASSDPLERAALVAAFVVSHYSSTAQRTAKPFNPLLAETYEYVSHEKGLAFVAEQVSHHPPMSAVHVTSSRGWTYDTTHQIHNRFHGNSLEVWPEGSVHVRLREHNEHYTYEQARTTVHNIVVGSLWLDNCGTVTIRERTRGEVTVTLRFKRYAYLFGEAKALGDVDGKVVHSSKRAGGGSSRRGSTTRKLAGNWNTSLSCDGKELWRATKRPPAIETAGHNMTSWGWGLNAPPIGDSAVGSLPRTDSRLRPDQRALENGKYDLATSEKARLEQKQRNTRQVRDTAGEMHQPRWFEWQRGVDGKKEWVYTGKYFEVKASGSWPADLPDIF